MERTTIDTTTDGRGKIRRRMSGLTRTLEAMKRGFVPCGQQDCVNRAVVLRGADKTPLCEFHSKNDLLDRKVADLREARRRGR